MGAREKAWQAILDAALGPIDNAVLRSKACQSPIFFPTSTAKSMIEHHPQPSTRISIALLYCA